MVQLCTTGVCIGLKIHGLLECATRFASKHKAGCANQVYQAVPLAAMACTLLRSIHSSVLGYCIVSG
jgi:hypothetical protein